MRVCVCMYLMVYPEDVQAAVKAQWDSPVSHDFSIASFTAQRSQAFHTYPLVGLIFG